MPEITEKMLIQELRELETDGVVVRTVHQVVPPRVDYVLAEQGEQVRPVLAGLPLLKATPLLLLGAWLLAGTTRAQVTPSGTASPATPPNSAPAPPPASTAWLTANRPSFPSRPPSSSAGGCGAARPCISTPRWPAAAA